MKMSNFKFKLMANCGMPFRDIFLPPKKIMEEIAIKKGDFILDFGCGPGSYSILAAQKTGENGKVYAQDIHPIALDYLTKKASKKRFQNIETKLSEGRIDLPDQSLDIVILFDVYHMLDDTEFVLNEIHRSLKQGGTLAFSDHHMKESKIMTELSKNNQFEFIKKGEKTFTFEKKA